MQGRTDDIDTLYRHALARLRRTPSLILFGTTPIKNDHYWSAALREGGVACQTLMATFYGTINQREDFDHYLTDYVPAWVTPGMSHMLAPYHAFLFVLLYGRVLHTSFDGGPLSQTPFAALEPRWLAQAGVKTVVFTYGSDGAVYSRIRDLSTRHALLQSYPRAARREPEILARLDRWNAHADCIIGGFHAVEGHARWDTLIPQPVVIDTELWTPVPHYSQNDGRNGPVRIIHSPNHRGFKGTEFLIAIVRELQAEGLQVELDLVEKVQNAEVRRRMRMADILAEQFIMPVYALSALEGMATGLPVMSNLCSEEYLTHFRRYAYLDECPIAGTTVETLKDNLRTLVTTPALREQLGRAGRVYAEKYHSYATARFMFDAIHRSLEGDTSVDLMRLFDPHFSTWRREQQVVHPLKRSMLVA